MKTYFRSTALAALTGVAALALSLASAPAEDSKATITSPATTSPYPGPILSTGVLDVLQLSQAKVGEDTIVNYVKSSGRGYTGLNANEIVYLHQQGVSDRVVSAMLDQRSQLTSAQPTAQAQTDSSAQYQQPAQQPATTTVTAPATPPVTYVQPASTVYVVRDSSPRLVDYGYYPYYYNPYPYYSGYYGGPRISVGLNFGGGWHGGGSWHGGGGGHGGGGWHH